MYEKLWNAQPTAAKRRVHFTFRDATTGDNKDPGTLNGIKANIRLDGGATNVVSTNDVAKLNQADHLGAGYIEFTAAEFTAFGSGELLISVSGIAGVKVEDAQATLYTFDPNAAGATTAQIASQVRTELAPELGDVVATNGVVNAIAGYVDTEVASIKSTVEGTAATIAAGLALTAVERKAIADALLARNQKGGADGPPEESVSAALAGGFFLFSGGDTATITINNGDGTPAFTRTLSRDLTKLLGAIIAASA